MTTFSLMFRRHLNWSTLIQQLKSCKINIKFSVSFNSAEFRDLVCAGLLLMYFSIFFFSSGHHNCHAQVFRTGKWAVPKYIYSARYFGPHVLGITYLIRSDILKSLLKASLSTPLLSLEDVYVTGLLAKEIGVTPLNSFFIPRHDQNIPEKSCWRSRMVS